MYEAITAGEKDYSALVSKLKRSNIDVLYLGGYHTEAGLIIRQMRNQGAHPLYLLTMIVRQYRILLQVKDYRLNLFTGIVIRK